MVRGKHIFGHSVSLTQISFYLSINKEIELIKNNDGQYGQFCTFHVNK